jgi:uncharacterized protein (TIGR00369 family)
MPKINPLHVKEVIGLINQAPYFQHLSMPLKNIGPGYSLLEMEIGREHLNPFGGLHGGAYASAIDTAAYWAVYCELSEAVGLITLDLKVDYLAPVNSGKVVVKGHSIKIGRTICLAEAVAMDENEKWLAHGVSKMMVTQGLQTLGDAFKFIGNQKLPPKFI